MEPHKSVWGFTESHIHVTGPSVIWRDSQELRTCFWDNCSNHPPPALLTWRGNAVSHIQAWWWECVGEDLHEFCRQWGATVQWGNQTFQHSCLPRIPNGVFCGALLEASWDQPLRVVTYILLWNVAQYRIFHNVKEYRVTKTHQCIFSPWQLD